MQVRSNIITARNIHDAVQGIDHVYIDDDGVKVSAGRDGRVCYTLYLEGYGDRHVRARNMRDGHAATWDDWGVFIKRLFLIDATAKIAHYDGLHQFTEYTSAYKPKDARAPWLSQDVTHPGFVWPDLTQQHIDTEKLKARGRKQVREEIRSLRRQADSLERILSEV